MNIVTRDTHSPSNRERLQSWEDRASVYVSDAAPNVIPLRPRNIGQVEKIAEAAIAYCRPRRYAPWIEREFVALALFRLRHGASEATAIGSAKVRADFCAKHGKAPTNGPEAA